MAAVETGFRALDEKSLVDYIKTIPSLVSKLGDQLEGLTIKEVGDGNLNFVYIVIGTSGGSFVIKQALPYVRLIGESWPMTKERAYFEALTLREHGRLCPEHVPEVYHFDRIMSLIAMRYLEPPHIILRKGLIAGIEYPLLAEHMSDYMAKTLFFTSMLYHSTTEHRQLVMAAVETGFRALDEKSLVDYIKTIPSLVSKLGDQLEGLTIKEVGDGNLNFVYIVIGTSGGSFVIKQALPYVRLIGESWPMTKERAYFEALTLREHGRLCPEHVPEVYHFDRIMSLIAMRYLEPPHIILRKGLIAGIEYPLLAEHMSDYMAKTLFFTSMLYHSTTEHRQLVAEYCGNLELCRLTEQVVFSDPYKESQYNRWTSPYLDQDAEAVRHDDLLKLEVAELKSMFIERAQALIHGDLHTSSVMVTHDSTQVIDPEFSVYGPMGYDIGAFIGNLIVSFFSQDGHSTLGNDRNSYKEWILKTIEDVWYLFQKKFTALWEEHKDGPGEAYLSAIYDSVDLLHLVQKKYMKDLFHDSLGFGAAKMIRRIVGVAHVEDFESIHDASSRADCERRALGFAKMLLKERRGFDTINQVVLAIQKLSP